MFYVDCSHCSYTVGRLRVVIFVLPHSFLNTNESTSNLHYKTFFTKLLKQKYCVHVNVSMFASHVRCLKNHFEYTHTHTHTHSFR